MYPARELARQEAQRLFFEVFLRSNEGQAFVTHTVQDGTLEPTEVSKHCHTRTLSRVGLPCRDVFEFYTQKGLYGVRVDHRLPVIACTRIRATQIFCGLDSAVTSPRVGPAFGETTSVVAIFSRMSRAGAGIS